MGDLCLVRAVKEHLPRCVAGVVLEYANDFNIALKRRLLEEDLPAYYEADEAHPCFMYYLRGLTFTRLYARVSRALVENLPFSATGKRMPGMPDLLPPIEDELRARVLQRRHIKPKSYLWW